MKRFCGRTSYSTCSASRQMVLAQKPVTLAGPLIFESLADILDIFFVFAESQLPHATRYV